MTMFTGQKVAAGTYGNTTTAVALSGERAAGMTIALVPEPITRRAHVSFAEMEAPNAVRRAHVSFAEMEAPNAVRRAHISFAEMEAPNAVRRGLVSFAEFEVPTSRRAQIGFAEFEIPHPPTRAQVSFAELQTPDIDLSLTGPGGEYVVFMRRRRRSKLN